jgi:hypothetical protein
MIVCLLLTRNIVNHRRIGHDSHARAELPSVRQQSLSPRFYISIKMQPCSSRSVKLRSLRLQHRMKGSGRMAPKGTHRGPAGGGHLDGGTPGRNSGGQTKPVDRQRLDQEMRQRRNVRFGASSTHGLNHIAERGAQANRAEIQGEVRKLHIDQAASKRKVVTNRRRPCDLCSGTKRLRWSTARTLRAIGPGPMVDIRSASDFPGGYLRLIPCNGRVASQPSRQPGRS